MKPFFLMLGPTKRIQERRGRSGPRPREKAFLFTGLWIALFPFVWFTLQWNLDRDIGFLLSVTSIPREGELLGSVKDSDDDTSGTSSEPARRKHRNESVIRDERMRPPTGLILNPMEYPIFDIHMHNVSKKTPLRVSFLGRNLLSKGANKAEEEDHRGGDQGEYYRGLMLSQYIKICSQRIWDDQRIHEPPPEESVVGVCEPQMLLIDWSALDRDCQTLQDLPDIPIVVLDASASPRVVECPEQWADRTIFVAKRSVVANRVWRFEKQTLHHGNLIVPSTGAIQSVRHISGLVPEAFAEVLRQHDGKDQRHVEVLHYWNSVTASDDITARQYSSWRAAVSHQLRSTKSSLEKKHKVGTWLDQFGLVNEDKYNDDEKEDKEDDEPTQQQLLKDMVLILTKAKIIVVAQSDEYEDHDNRLMEALASGALVMMDTMLAPTTGLVNSTNLIFYDSTKSLDRLVRYYLQHPSERHAIARRGQEFALKQHRCWHVMESLLFGSRTTP